MIEELRIDDVGVIVSARVPLGQGLTAITGETGAGKTMVLTGLALILGGKADAALVRAGAERATAEGCFVVDPSSAVAERAREAGAVVDEDGTLLAMRTVAAAGRSRAFLGGRGVPAAVLVEIADQLVTVHGQQDQTRLRSPRRQREALDGFAGPAHLGELAAYRETWAALQQAKADREDLLAHVEDRRREAELLRAGLAEVERVDPRPGEDTELAAEAERLGHAEDLAEAAALAHRMIVGTSGMDTPGAAPVVEQARRALESVGGHDAQLASLATRAAEVGYLLEDLAAELARYGQDLEADPARLEEIHRRRAELTMLARSHGGTVDEVLDWASQAGLRLARIDTAEGAEELESAIARLEASLAELGARLTASRTVAAERLADAVSEELSGLAMPDARLEVRVDALSERGPWGAEDVAMLLVPHAGATARPLGVGASGGELSRVMLALEVALATAPGSGASRPATFVFDEVDAGVGGRAAVEVGRRLAELAQQAQVVVVTHLPQVAAYADHHLVVRKSQQEGAEVVTASDVRAVTGADRVAELARMLSGRVTDTALQHAAELLERSVVGR
ncbi:DNA repair protein RecN [Actinotalea sp.]|uniref:DNA repair protein RecN n=1 Tax=Actinotalea sp. TaxID=1872145 RepID=UPI003568EDC0